MLVLPHLSSSLFPFAADSFFVLLFAPGITGARSFPITLLTYLPHLVFLEHVHSGEANKTEEVVRLFADKNRYLFYLPQSRLEQ